MTTNFDRIYERWERKVKAQGRAEGRAEGEVGGRAVALVAVLESRGLAMTEAQRKQILDCTDVARLDAWLRAVHATPSVAALLAGSPSRRPARAR